MTLTQLIRHNWQNAKFVNRLIQNANQPIGMYAQIQLTDKVTVLYNVNDLKGAVINVRFHRLLKQTAKETRTLRVVKQFVIDRTLLSPIQCMQIERVIHSSVMVTVNLCNETEE